MTLPYRCRNSRKASRIAQMLRINLALSLDLLGHFARLILARMHPWCTLDAPGYDPFSAFPTTRRPWPPQVPRRALSVRYFSSFLGARWDPLRLSLDCPLATLVPLRFPPSRRLEDLGHRRCLTGRYLGAISAPF